MEMGQARSKYNLIVFERARKKIIPGRELLIGLWNSDVVLSIEQYKRLKEYYGDNLDYEIHIRKVSLLVTEEKKKYDARY